MAKKKSSTSPTQRTLALCKRQGWTCQIVERWNSFAKIRQDLFGFIDVVVADGSNILGIQTTSGDNFAARLEKIKAEPRALAWLNSGGRIFIHGWRKLKATGRWDCRELEVTREMLNDIA
jgi:hypothetical protein